jgi:hypothetical protein
VRPYGFLLRKAPVFGGEGKWVCDTDQGPVAYSTEDAAALEQAFALGVPRVVPVCKGVNEVNLDSMKQINVKTRLERPVTRLTTPESPQANSMMGMCRRESPVGLHIPPPRGH